MYYIFSMDLDKFEFMIFLFTSACIALTKEDLPVPFAHKRALLLGNHSKNLKYYLEEYFFDFLNL